MAKCTVVLPDDIAKRFEKLGSNMDAVAEKMLEAGGKVVLEKTKSTLSSVIGKGTKYPSRSTGQLERSLGVSKPRLDKNGNMDVKIGFAEKQT